MQLIRLILVVAVAFVTSAACGESNYAFVFEKSDYAVNPGGTVDVQVYLQETDGTQLRDIGLVGTGVRICSTDLPQPESPAKVLSDSDVFNVSDFDVVWSKTADPDLGCAGLSLGTFGKVYGLETATGSDIYRVLLGKFTFTAGSIANETTHIRVTDFNPALSDTVLADYTDLDSVIADGTATITTIAQIPGDANNDGKVDGSDVTILAGNWQNS